MQQFAQHLFLHNSCAVSHAKGPGKQCNSHMLKVLVAGALYRVSVPPVQSGIAGKTLRSGSALRRHPSCHQEAYSLDGHRTSGCSIQDQSNSAVGLEHDGSAVQTSLHSTPDGLASHSGRNPLPGHQVCAVPQLQVSQCQATGSQQQPGGDRV